MAKSVGEIMQVEKLIEEGINPLAFRLFCYSSHYRAQLTYAPDAIKAAQTGLDGLYNFMQRLKDVSNDVKNADVKKLVEESTKKFIDHVNDDLDMPKAMTVVWDFVHKINKMADENKLGKTDANLIYKTMLDFDKILGLKLGEQKEEKVPAEILDLVNKREEARKNKNFKLADELREKIKQLGWQVDDADKGAKVKKLR